MLGLTKLVLDLVHNSFEWFSDGRVIIRKGEVRVEPGGLNVVPPTSAAISSLSRPAITSVKP